MSQLIATKQLSFSYNPKSDNYSVVLDNIEITISDGDFVAIIGRNGCGKSTLVKHFNAMLSPTTGDVLIGDINTKDNDRVYDIRQLVGMVFQNPDNQIVATTVADDVAFALENLGVSPPEIRSRVSEALSAVGMLESRLDTVHKLSGGQKQKIAIAGIIALRPKCIILDEPTAMLDPVGRKAVNDIIKILNHDFGITIIYITHFMEEAALANRLIVMDEGKIIMDDKPKAVFSQSELLYNIGLDIPVVTKLVNQLADLGCVLPKGILTVEECVDAIDNLFKKIK